MNRTFLTGLVVVTIGLAGYLAGIAVAYPGRALSVTAIMIGVTLVAVGRADGVGEVWR